MSTVLLNSQVCSKFSSPFQGLQVEHKVNEIHFNYNDLKREGGREREREREMAE
jgi:hypothetical protein